MLQTNFTEHTLEILDLLLHCTGLEITHGTSIHFKTHGTLIAVVPCAFAEQVPFAKFQYIFKLSSKRSTPYKSKLLSPLRTRFEAWMYKNT